MALRTRMRNMIQDQILKPIKEPKVLILDDFTTRMVTNAMSMTEITQGCDVLAVQRVTTVPHSSNGLFSAVYFMRPTEKNIQKYIKDFSTKPNPYNNGYIFLTNACPDGLFTMLQKSKIGKQKLKAFTELYCDYICYSENSFSFEEPSHFNTYYNPSRESERGYDSIKIATKLVTLCVQLQHFPGKIRYFNSACGKANNEIASNVKRYLSHFKNDNENFKWKSVNSTVLILDRSFDTITPVIHDLTTEALARDLLSIDVEANAQSDQRKGSYFPNQYVFSAQTGASEEKEEMTAFLDDSNILWKKIRFMNIKDAIKCIHNLILDIKQQRQLEAGKVQDLTLTELKELMKRYPEQRKLKKQVGALSSLLEAVLDGFALEQIKCEQTLATNCSKKPKDNKNWKVVSELLKQNSKGELNNALNMHEKLRLLILYARSKATIQGISFRELKSRLKESDIPQEFGTIVTNLTYMGVPVVQNDSQWDKYQDQNRYWKSWACVDMEKGEKIRPDYMPDFVQWCPTIYHLVKTLIETPDEMISKYPIIELWNKPLIRRRRTRSNPGTVSFSFSP
ncbi:syntaxin-binding protein 1-like isoform X2 [Convolutriloba macropyga]